MEMLGHGGEKDVLIANVDPFAVIVMLKDGGLGPAP